ncbi:hypothetical protein EMIHUDRAFT_252361, partial [Emiliania huxleyi CCMP1516]
MVWLDNVDVLVQTLCARSQRPVRTQQMRRTAIGFCLDDSNRALLVVGDRAKEKEQHEWPVAGGVALLARFVRDGKATLTLARQHKQILLSNAEPARLAEWLHALKGGAAGRRDERPAASPPPRPLAKRTPAAANVAASPSLASPTVVSRRKARDLRPSPGSLPLRPSPVLSPSTRQALSEERQPRSGPRWRTVIMQEQQAVLKAALRGESFFFTGGAGTG